MTEIMSTPGVSSQWRTGWRVARALAVVAAAATLVVTGVMMPFDDANADHGEHVTVPERDGRQFVYPVPSWIAANDHYYPGTPHSGSADLAAPLYTPVYPARSGEVVYADYRGGSWGVRIEHEDVGEHTYVTGYGHLAEKPLVTKGDRVGLNDPIGYLGQTGNANWSGPHIHFTISQQDRDGDRREVRIPRLDFGDWVDGNDYIFGDYQGLAPIEWRPNRTFDVTVSDPWLRMYETTSRNASQIITELPNGETVTVTGSHRGQYQVEVDGQTGWIAHSGTRPVNSTVFGVRITASSRAVVRREATANSEQIGSIGPGLLVGYQREGNWLRVSWPCDTATNRITDPDSRDSTQALGGCPLRKQGQAPYFKYGWVGPAIAEPVAATTVRTRVFDVAVFRNVVIDGEPQPDCPCNANSASRIGTINGIRQEVVAEGTRNGWYRITHDGDTAWIKGWLTAGPQSTRLDRQ